MKGGGEWSEHKKWLRYHWSCLQLGNRLSDGLRRLLPSWIWHKTYNKTFQDFFPPISGTSLWVFGQTSDCSLSKLTLSLWTFLVMLCLTSVITDETFTSFRQKKKSPVSSSSVLWGSSLSNCSWSHFPWIIPSWYLQNCQWIMEATEIRK